MMEKVDVTFSRHAARRIVEGGCEKVVWRELKVDTQWKWLDGKTCRSNL
jgi:hypothetical protein